MIEFLPELSGAAVCQLLPGKVRSADSPVPAGQKGQGVPGGRRQQRLHRLLQLLHAHAEHVLLPRIAGLARGDRGQDQAALGGVLIGGRGN